MLHLVALALRRQVCGIRTLVTSVLSTAALLAGVSLPAGAQPQAMVAPAAAPAVAPAVPPASGRRVVAVLLPIDSQTFARAATHVRNGMTAAWSQSPGKGQTELRFIPIGDQPNDVVAAYNLALAGGAQVIVGPLIRDQATALANALAQSAPVTVPTIALNAADGATRLAPNLFLFGLSTEGEARQVARFALRNGHKRALVLTQPTVLSRRLQQAFIEAFSEGGGTIAAQHAVVTDPGAMNRMRATTANTGADMIFLAADLPAARTVRPFLDTQLPTYATSQLWSGPIDPNANLDLNGTRLLDMPWLLEPDHAAVMVFARSQPALPPENERLYALGIDAYRLAELAIDRGIQPGLSLDGVTGRITLERGNWLVREPVPAQVWQGQLVPGTDRR
ncbi:MAG: penicillin-binding protein activator [Burkholderiales bacterium]|nr:penicillin-binding protein activator [Burkholderiales bacterium]